MRFKKTIAVILSLVFMTGCRGKKIEYEERKDIYQGKIIIWTSKDNMTHLKTSSDNYKRIHENVTVDIIEVNNQDMQTKLEGELKANENIPDIICVEDEYAQGMIIKFLKNLENTGSYIKKENYLKYKIDNLTADNNLYGIPLNSKPVLMAYREDLLKVNSINPEYIKTWQDFIDAGKALKNQNKYMTAFALENEQTYRAFLNQLGGSYFDAEGKPVLNSPVTIKAIEVLKRSYTSGIVKNAKTSEEIMNMIRTGEIASAFVTTEELKQLEKNTELEGKIQIMKVPAFEEGGNQSISMGGSNLMLMSNGKNKNTALDFSKYTAENKDNISSLIKEVGAFPAYSYNYDEKWFKQGYYYLYSKVVKDVYSTKYTQDFYTVSKTAIEAFSSVVLKDQDIKITLDDFQKNLPILK
jgi:ABC-type glycerol-3-phosphate transport system substrate-binding protein